MFRFVGRVLRFSFWTALVGIAVISLVGASRVKNAWFSVREHLRGSVDGLVDTRVALQREISGLAEEYPRRIAELRVAVSDIERDIAACEEQRRLSDQVVALCRGDVKALTAGTAALDGGTETIAFRGERLRRPEAEARAARILETAAVHEQRGAELDRERALLGTERERLSAELARLTVESREFEAEAKSMLREIDALSRQERLVQMAEQRENRETSPLAAREGALSAVRAKIERRRIELEERMKALGTLTTGGEYEARARLTLSTATR